MLAALISAVLLATASLSAHAADPLQVGFSTDKPPYVFESEQRGIEVDIVLAALRKAGYEASPSFMPMERLHKLLESKQIDAIATTSAASGVASFYSAPYVEYHNVAAALASRQLKINGIRDLEGLSISSFQRARKLLGPEFEAMAARNRNYREEANQVTRNLLLYAGRVDVVVGDKLIIDHFRAQVGDRVDIAQPLVYYPIFAPTPYSVGFLKAEHQRAFDEALAQMRKDGSYAAILRRYQ